MKKKRDVEINKIKTVFGESAVPAPEKINAPIDGWHNTFLHRLSDSIHTSAAEIRTAVEMGADVNIQNKSGETPLMLAISKDNGDVVRALLQQGADIVVPSGKKNELPFNAVTQAICAGNVKMLQIVLEEGGGRYVNYQGNTKWREADGMSGVALLARAYKTQGMRLEEDKYIKMARLLIQAGAFLEGESGPSDLTPLMHAATAGSTALVHLIMESGADLNYQHSKTGHTILHHIADTEYHLMATPLIARGARTDIRDREGRLPLHIAARDARLYMMKALLQHSAADVNARVVGGREETPLHLAAQANSLICAETLLEKGADPAATDLSGHTPKQHADPKAAVYAPLARAEDAALRRRHDEGYHKAYKPPSP
ncbi:MAG: ankyrin repeat domain-containing protein [Alphaproteobacteria bacterium]|nr:ankyrin repeat domain-containing protein [Alphaproteobacteria bacterium]